MKRQGFSHLKSNENHAALKQRERRSSIAIVIDFNRYLTSTTSSVCRTLSRSLAYIVNWIIFNTGKRRNILSIFEVPLSGYVLYTNMLGHFDQTWAIDF